MILFSSIICKLHTVLEIVSSKRRQKVRLKETDSMKLEDVHSGNNVSLGAVQVMLNEVLNVLVLQSLMGEVGGAKREKENELQVFLMKYYKFWYLKYKTW